jgi:hypothetical protein
MADDKATLTVKTTPEANQAETHALPSAELKSQKPQADISPTSRLTRTRTPGRMPLFRN